MAIPSAPISSISRSAASRPRCTSCCAPRLAKSRGGRAGRTSKVGRSSGWSSNTRIEPTPKAMPSSSATRARSRLIWPARSVPPVIPTTIRGARRRPPERSAERSTSERRSSGSARWTSRTQRKRGSVPAGSTSSRSARSRCCDLRRLTSSCTPEGLTHRRPGVARTVHGTARPRPARDGTKWPRRTPRRRRTARRFCLRDLRALRRDLLELGDMSVFRDESGRRGAAVRLASVVAGVAALAAFVVNWDPASLRSLQQHADQLTHVMPEWIRIQPGGDFSVEEDARVLQAAQHLEVVPTVSNYGPDGFSRGLAQAVLATDALRKEAARKLARICEERGYAGVNVDLEDLGAQGFQKLALFVEALWSELHPRGFLVTVDVPADPKDVPVERLASSTDFLVLMAYDEHSADDNPGPIASPESVARSAGEYLRRAPAEKLVLAIGAYGYDWPLDSDGDAARPAEELSYAQALVLARENEVPIEWDARARGPFFEYDDEEAHEKHAVRFLDAPAEAAQLQGVFALRLRGTALWRLGAEDPKLFDLFARPPAPRTFDPEAARHALDGVIANDPDDVQTE